MSLSTTSFTGFSFTKKIEHKVLKDKVLNNDVTSTVETTECDFITAIDSKEVVSAKPPPVEQKFVIPLIECNRWRSVKSVQHSITEEGSQKSTVGAQEIGKDDELTCLAKEALLKEAANANDQSILETTDGLPKNVAIPLLLQNRVPNGFETDDHLDVSLRADEPDVVDYDEMPIEEYGKAMLRGMGWNEGDPIGRTNKKNVEMRVPKLRPKGMGLGAEQSLSKMHAPAPTASTSRSTDELILTKGAFVKIISGTKKNMYGKVEGFDEDNARVVLRLALGQNVIAISQFAIQLVTKEEFERDSKCLNKEKYEKYVQPPTCTDDTGRASPVKEPPKPKRNSERPDRKRRASSPHWLWKDLKVRVVDKDYDGGRHYKSKVVVEDVFGHKRCTCISEKGRLLEDMSQTMLETVVPRDDSALVMIVLGSQRGQLGRIVERNSKSCEAVVQLLRNRTKLVPVSYNAVCEFAGNAMED